MKNQFVLRHANNGVWYGTFSHFDQYGLVHGVSTRLHGSSAKPFHSLNLGLHTGDNPENVLHNRKLFAAAVGVDAQAVVTAQQVHEDTIGIIKTASLDSANAREYQRTFAATDALITVESSIPLMLFFADCVPVLFFEPVKRVVAISHAGWKGTVARIAAKTLTKMKSEYNINPQDCLIGIGPSIGQCCYEVDDTVISKLRQEFASDWSKFVIPRNERWMLDLWKVNEMQLLEAGAKQQNILTSGVCTSCNNSLFYSHRTEKGKTGRLGAVIQL